MTFGFFTARIEDVLAWARRASLWPAAFFGACCAAEVEDPAFGGLLGRMSGCNLSPEGSDLLVVAGAVTHKRALLLRSIYDRMARPRWVLAVGACASTGGCFRNYSVPGGAAGVIPVDAFVPGCPPRPEQIASALERIRGRIERATGGDRDGENS